MIDPFKTKAIGRLKKAKGQLDGVIKMIENDKYCIDIITQILALQGSIKGIGELVLESHLNTCGHNLSAKDLKKKKQFIAEIIKASKLSN